MKHAVRIAKISKRTIPPGMRGISVDGETYFYRVSNGGEGIVVLDSLRKPFHSLQLGTECTWRPSHIADMIREVLRGSRQLPGKGDHRCNRAACQEVIRGSRWWNSSTRAFYCEYCAGLINSCNPGLCGVEVVA